MSLAPQSVYRACLRGLKRHDRARRFTNDTGATAAALSFAEVVAEGFPIDVATAVEVLEAHRLLDQAPRHPDGESDQEIVSRLLWGGDDAPEWAERVVSEDRQSQLDALPPPPAPVVTTDPPPHSVPPLVLTTPDIPEYVERPVGTTDVFGQPIDPLNVRPDHEERAFDELVNRPDTVAAATETENILDALADELFDLDDLTLAELRSAFLVAYRTALRASSSAARQATRVSKADQIAAGLEDDAIYVARDVIKNAGRYDGYLAIPDNVAAVISVDLDRALANALDDYQEVVAGVLGRARRSAVRRIADAVGVGVGDVEGLAASDDAILDSASELRLSLHEWVRARLEGEREPDDLQDMAAPEVAFAVALRTAGGGAVDDDESDSIAAPLASRVLDRISRGLMNSTVVGLAATIIRPRWTWNYGDPASRESGPFEPHLRLRNQTWTTPEERLQKIGTASPKRPHSTCQCRIRRSWEILPGLRSSA